MTTLVNRVIFKSNKNNGLGTSIDIQGNIDISGNIIPSSNSFDLGSNTQRWRDMHFSGNLYQNGSSYIGSQWITSGSKLYYTAGNIGIGTNNPINTLDVSGNSRISGNIAVGGNLSVSGTLTTIDSTTVTVQDPIITLSQSVLTSNDNKDRGIEFLYYDGSSKRGFFGFDNTNSNLIYLINATNTSEVFSGTYGNIQGGSFISSNTSGAPLTVSSSGLVTNLNADLLDGQDGTYYRNMNNVTNGTLTVNYGGTGANSLSSGKLLVGAGTSAISTPVDLTWNGSNLGIGSSNPSQKLDVSGNINFTGILYQNSLPYIGSQWTTSGNTIFYNTGNVGIGSSNPSQKLDIIGSVKATSFIGSGASLQSIYQASRIFNVSTPIFNYNIQDISGDNPIIQVTSGHTYAFSLNVPSHPFNIRTIANQSSSNIIIGMIHIAPDGTILTGSNANNKTDGTIFWTIPYDIIPVGNSNVTVFYQCGVHTSMIGNIIINSNNSTQWTDGSSNKIYYNTGNVGIGSSNPSQKLDVSGNIAASGNISAGNYVSCANINFTGDLYKNSSLYVGSQWTTTSNKIYYNTGNVGIGTLNPSSTLDITGNIYASNNITANNNIIGTRLISFVTSGTAPLTVTSTTLVTNLNADLLDNQDSAYYLNYNNLTNKPIISSTQWTTSGTKIYYNAGNVGIGLTNPNNTLDVGGNIYATGDVSAFSDKRYKTNIEKITNAIDKINAINGYTFNRVENMERRMMGVIAQELELVIPEVVYQQGDTLSVAYGNIVAVCIEAIKELDVKIKELEKVIKK